MALKMTRQPQDFGVFLNGLVLWITTYSVGSIVHSNLPALQYQVIEMEHLKPCLIRPVVCCAQDLTSPDTFLPGQLQEEHEHSLCCLFLRPES